MCVRAYVCARACIFVCCLGGGHLPGSYKPMIWCCVFVVVAFLLLLGSLLLLSLLLFGGSR